MKELEKRRVATAKTLDKFRGQPFDWRKCSTCLHLARAQMVNMGHKPPRMPKFKNAVGAKKALKERGFDSVTELLDSMFERIAPAEMRLGDLGAFPGTEGLDGIAINVAPRKMACWREDAPALTVIDVSLDEMATAWRL